MDSEISNRRISNIIMSIYIVFFLPSITLHIIHIILLYNQNNILLLSFVSFVLIILILFFLVQTIRTYNLLNVPSFSKSEYLLKTLLLFTNIINFIIYLRFKIDYFLVFCIFNTLILAIQYLIVIILFVSLLICYPSFLTLLNMNELTEGITSEQINLIQIIKLTHNLDEHCSICLDEFKEGDELRFVECDHNFHKECLDKWLLLKNTCPICRKNIIPNA